MKTFLFFTTAQHFLRLFHGSIVPTSVQNPSVELLGHQVGQGKKAPGRLERRLRRMSGAIWAAKGVTTPCDGGFPRLHQGRRVGIEDE